MSARLLNIRFMPSAGVASAIVSLAVIGGLISTHEALAEVGAVTSADGTPIAFDCVGEGPALILVGGALSDRSAWAPVAKLLAPHFTVYSYDRRGRGNSGDAVPYFVEREIEDLEAIIDQAGGITFIHGQSSGAVLSLEAAAKLPGKVKKLSLYEPPFIVDDSRPLPPVNYVAHIKQLLEDNRRSEAVEFWMTYVVLAPAEAVAEMKDAPSWPALEALAHTLPYDIAVLGDGMAGKPLQIEEWTDVTVPTLVIDGGASPQWIRNSARALAEVLTDAEYRTLEGQTHNASPNDLARELERFFTP